MSAAVSSRLLGRLGLDVRPAEVLTASSLFLYFFLIGTVQSAGKTVRQSTFIDSLGSDKLPYVYLLVAVCAYPVIRYYERLCDRMPIYRVMVATTVLFAVGFATFWWLYGYPWQSVRFLYYLWFSIATVILVSQVWSFANQVFDARQARRLFGFIGAGGLLGLTAGGLVALLARHEPRMVLLIGAALLLAAAPLLPAIERLGQLRRGAFARQPRLEQTSGGFEAIRRSRHLQVITALMFLSVMAAQIVEFQFNAVIEREVEGLDERTAKFGIVFSIMGFSAFLFQLLVTARIHRTLGVGFGMRVLPVTVLVGSGLLLLSGPPMLLLAPLLVVSVLRVGEAGVRYSLDQATRELLFVPIPPGERLKAKALIDVLVQRFARGAAALLLLTVTFGKLTALEASWITLGVALIWLWMTGSAQSQYVRSLRRGLDSSRLSGPGVDRFELLDPGDVTTLEVLVESLGSPDPQQVIRSVDLLAAHGRGRLVPPLLLYHDDAEVRLRTLKVLAAEGRSDAVPLVERLIGDPDLDVRAEAMRTLALLLGTEGPQIMQTRLDDPDLRVRSAAIASLASQGRGEEIARAEKALLELMSDADPAARREAAKALADIAEPGLQEHVVQLLYDGDTSVVKQTIGAVRRRVERYGFAPLYVPILISLLRDRRLKHDAREALVSCGEEVIPALVHFMNDPNELIWVRRALPKTIARLKTPSAKRALLGSLGAGDLFLRGKVIEALGSLDRLESGAAEVQEQLLAECGHYASRLTELVGISRKRDFRLLGPTLVWPRRRLPSLLQELLADRMRNHLRNIFGLLAVTAPRQDIWGAYQRLLGSSRPLRGHALEYLDTILDGGMRRQVLMVIDDLVLSERLRLARRYFGSEVRSKVETLERLISSLPRGEADASWIAAAAVHTVWADRVEPLYDRVQRAAIGAEDPLVRETAVWVAGELRRGAAETA